MTLAAHIAFAVIAAVVLWRSLAQGWVDDLTSDLVARNVVRLGLVLASLTGSVLAIGAARITRQPGRVLSYDAISFAAVLVLLFALSLGPIDRDVIGLCFIATVIVRFAPAAVTAIDQSPWLFCLVYALGIYACLAAWHQAASLPLGDQVHYLLATDRLAHGSLDATIDPGLFRKLTTIDPSEADVATHVVNAPAGPRTVQGYALPMLLLPGWILAGRFGAELVVALAAAWAAAMTALILGDTILDRRLRGWVWAMTAFLPPLVLLATHIYPNAFGAAAIATSYRLGFSATVRRPALAGAIGGLTLFLNPRDGLVLLVLLAASAWYGRDHLLRFGSAVAAVGIVAIASNAILYGLPVPYAGYFFGTSQAQALTSAPSITFQFWVGLPAILFDRTFGLAGSAPWLCIPAIGAIPAVRAAPRALAPAGAAIVTSLVALSIYRYWEGGYAPPNRYLVEVVPLTAPFVAYGLAAIRDWWMRVFVGLLIGMSAYAGVLLSAMPARALNDAFQQHLQDLLDVTLGLNPLGWLPSFIPTTPDWFIAAYLRLIPAIAILVLLIWYGYGARRQVRI